MHDLYFNPVLGWPFAIGVALVLVALLLVGPARSRTTRSQRLVLAALRLLIVLLLLFVLLRPAQVTTETDRQAASLVVLADASRSLQVADALAGQSRWSVLRSTIEKASPQFEKLAEEVDIRFYTFDDEVRVREVETGKIALPESPDGQQTAIGFALDYVVSRTGNENLIGVLLLSDGAQRAYAPVDVDPYVAARRLEDRGWRLDTFAVGQSKAASQTRDVAITQLLAARTVFVKNELFVQGTVRSSGYSDVPLTVQLLWEKSPGNMEVVAAETVTARQPEQTLDVQLSYVPEVPGEHKLTLRVAEQDGELLTTNNELSTFVSVLKGGVNIAYFEGEYRFEQTAIRRAIDESPDMKIDYFPFYETPSASNKLRIEDQFEPGKYDVFLIGDLDSLAWKPEDLEALAERVSAGAGLMLIGGRQSFGAGGYHQTPLVGVLPIRIERLERQDVDPEAPVAEDLHVKGPLQMVPAEPFGVSHPVMALGKQNEKLWQALPPLGGANRFRGIKDGAQLLGVAEGKDIPLLVAGTWDNGRVLAFAGDTTWYWRFRGEEDFGDLHTRFWRQVMLWLAKKDESTEGNVWVKLDQRRFQPRDRVQFTVGANSPTGEPIENARFECHVILPNGERREVGLQSRSDATSGTFLGTELPGDYTIEVSATGGGESIGQGRARFLVTATDLELDNPAADRGLLSIIAKETGGQQYEIEDFQRVLERLADERIPELTYEREVTATYWDRWEILLLFVALAGLEWFLRKKWGLV